MYGVCLPVCGLRKCGGSCGKIQSVGSGNRGYFDRPRLCLPHSCADFRFPWPYATSADRSVEDTLVVLGYSQDFYTAKKARNLRFLAFRSIDKNLTEANSRLPNESQG
jgi:hypothetical protein